jgi:drug/metabolite transporter (DMT)-like permease
MAPTVPAKADLVRTALLCTLGCGLFAAANACAKTALTMLPGPELHPVQVTAARFLFGALALLPFILRAGPGVLRSAVPLRHVQRIAFGLGGVTSMFFAVQAMPLADATAIGRTAPLFTLLFAALLMKERGGWMRWLAAGIGFGGVVVVMRPTAATFDLVGLIPLLAAFCTGVEVATIRVLALRDKPLTVLALNNIGGASIACLAAAFVFVMPSWQQGIALVGVGVAMVSGQALIVRAFAVAEASVIAPFYYTTIAWAVLIGVVVFGEGITTALIMGTGLIALAGVIVAMHNPSKSRSG